MEKLSKRAENLLRELLINQNQLYGCLRDKFEEIAGNDKEIMKIRSVIGELKDKGYLNCNWGDGIPSSPSLTHIADEYFEIEDLKELELTQENMILMLREIADDYKIDNVLIYSVPSCGYGQIGWEQVDELEWRVRVEYPDFLIVKRITKQIERKLNLYNYIKTKSETNEKGSRKIIAQYYKHNSIINEGNMGKEDTGAIINSLMKACLSLQANKLVKSGTEDDISTYIRDILINKGLRVLDQTLRGKSATGKQSGEVDLFITDDENKPLILIEAFKLASLDRKNIDLHISKIFGYDPNGLSTNIVLIYSYANDFKRLFDNYTGYLKEMKLKYKFSRVIDKSSDMYSEIRVLESEYTRSGMARRLVHILINLLD